MIKINCFTKTGFPQILILICFFFKNSIEARPKFTSFLLKNGVEVYGSDINAICDISLMGVDILDFLNTFLKPKVFTPPQISNKSKESLFLTCSVKCSIYFGIYEPNLGESYRSNPGEPTHAGSPFRSYSTHFILSLLFIILESCRILLLVYLPQNRPESPAKLLEIHFGKGEISGVTNSHITLQHLQYLCSMYVWVSL